MWGFVVVLSFFLSFFLLKWGRIWMDHVNCKQALFKQRKYIYDVLRFWFTLFRLSSSSSSSSSSFFFFFFFFLLLLLLILLFLLLLLLLLLFHHLLFLHLLLLLLLVTVVLLLFFFLSFYFVFFFGLNNIYFIYSYIDKKTVGPSNKQTLLILVRP